MESRIKELSEYVKQLLSSSKQRFELGTAPNAPGVYAIFESDDSLIYIGKTSNLKRRILGNHRSGNRRGSAFRKALSEDKAFHTENEISDYIRRGCSFRYLQIKKDLSAIEHFAIAVLEPRLNK